MKRLLSLWLVFCMTLLGTAAYAAEEAQTAGGPTAAGTAYETAVATLTELNILRQDDAHPFRADETVTRGDLAVLITRFLSLEDEAEQITSGMIFSDVDMLHPAVNSIHLMCEKGMMNGYGNGAFGPDDAVTYEQAVKTIVTALGFGDLAAKKGEYPWGTLMVAAEKGMLGTETPEVGKTLRQGQLAQLLYRAASTPAANGEALVSEVEMVYYYVSPNGDDDNPGTEAKPWKTFYHAARTCQPGTTVIFEDGEYYEPDVTRFAQGGTEKAPIIYMARNKRMAKLIYPEDGYNKVKIDIDSHQEYITVQDFSITQLKKAKDGDPNQGWDSMIGCRGDHTRIIGNHLYYGFEDGIKTGGPDDLIIEGNTISDFDHEGIDAFQVINAKIRGNELIDCGRVPIMVKGSARNTLIYNNIVRNEKRKTTDAAITMGGISNNYNPLDVRAGTGFEAYFLVAYNNVIYTPSPDLLPAGICFLSSTDCRAYNNIVIGAGAAFKFQEAPGLANGWGWDPPVKNPVLKNNIAVNCKKGYNITRPVQGKMDSSNNIFYNTPKPSEPGNFTVDPQFVDEKGDLHLQLGSPAIGKGVPLPAEIVGYDGKTFKLDLVDFDGNPLTEPWDIGIYNY